MNLTGERRGSSFGGSSENGLGDFDNSSITSGISNYYLLSLGCGKPGARSIRLSNPLSRLDFRQPTADGVGLMCRYFGTETRVTRGRNRTPETPETPETRGQTERFPVFLALSSGRKPVNVPSVPGFCTQVFQVFTRFSRIFL
jgi:hypothetical protein